METNNPRIAVVGCGGWGKNLVRNFFQLGALEAIVEANPDNAAKFSEEFSCQNLSFEQVLASPEIEGVVIATPAETHFALAMQALEAGKHTYVEKPLALNVSEAKSLCEFAEKANLTLMVGHLLQYHPAFLKLKEMVQDNKLGRLQQLFSRRLSFGKIRTEEDVMWSFAPHDVSMLLGLVGEAPTTVDAWGSYTLSSELADSATINMNFSNGTTAQVSCSWVSPAKEQKLVVIGERGMAVFDDTLPWEEKLTFFPHKIHKQKGAFVTEKADGEKIEVVQAEPLKEETRHFLECISENKIARTDGREGMRVLDVLARASDVLLEKRRLSKPEEPSFMVHESSYIDENVKIGNGTKIWHFSHILGNVVIGENCNLGQNVVAGPDVTIGNNVKIQNNVSIYKGVTLEDDVFCGPSCVFTNVNNPRSAINRKSEYLATIVKKGVSIGANATIVCGHSLGEYCFIAAGAVVADDVKPYALMAGVPAKQIGWMSQAGGKLDDTLICPVDGTKYQLDSDGNLTPAR